MDKNRKLSESVIDTLKKQSQERAAAARKNREEAGKHFAKTGSRTRPAGPEVAKKKEREDSSRQELANRVAEAFQRGLKDKARGIQNKKPGTSNRTAVFDAARAEGDANVKKAQGKNTPRSVFGGKSNQDSATAAGGTVGDAAKRTPPESEHSMNRRKPADQESINKKTDAQGKVSGAFYQAAGGNKRAQKQANRTMLANKLKSKYNR